MTLELTDESLLAQYEVSDYVTLPTFQIPTDGTKVFIKSNGPIAVLEGVQATRRRRSTTSDDGKELPPAKYMTVTDLRTGRKGRIICPAVIESSLNDKYPNATYVDKVFQINYVGKVKGGSGFTYNSYDILELKPKTAAPPVAQSARKTA